MSATQHLPIGIQVKTDYCLLNLKFTFSFITKSIKDKNPIYKGLITTLLKYMNCARKKYIKKKKSAVKL